MENEVAVVPATARDGPDDMFGGLATLDLANDGVEIEIMRPDGDSSGIWIKMLGQDSDAYQKLRDKHDRARSKLIAKGGRSAVDSIFDGSKNNEMELVIKCCVSWRHSAGKPMPFRIGDDEEATRDFFKKYPVVYDQVRVGILDRANFTKPLAKQ